MPAFDVVLHVTNVDVTPAEPPITINETAGTSLVLLSVAFGFADSAALKVGVPFTLASDQSARLLVAGDRIIDTWLEVPTAFDGTTPLADVGLFSGSGFFATAGLLAGLAGHAWDLTADEVATGCFAFSGGNPDDFINAGVANNGYQPPRVVIPGALKLVATQDGSTAGTALDSAAGEATAFALILPKPA